MASADLSLQLEDDVLAVSSHGRAGRFGLYMALIAAWIATCGSLFMSEAMGWIPCLWCWYQRIFMYPIAVILAVGLWRRDRSVAVYSLVLSIIGIAASTYHILLQKVPAIARFETCTIGVPCSADYLNWFGFVTIPMLAWVAFAAIIIGSVLALRANRNSDENYLTTSPLMGLTPAFIVPLTVVAIAALFLFSGIITRGRQPAASIASVTQTTGAGNATSRDTALSIFSQSCAGCHGPANAGMQLMRPEFIREKSDLELMAMIRSGRNANSLDNYTGAAMPANGGRLTMTDDELLAIVKYLKEVKGS
jgi:disulfide bond formation protein DsbB/mono/diheme cytochrome c family protein